jgi:two-component system CheB/CheR fusion protein
MAFAEEFMHTSIRGQDADLLKVLVVEDNRDAAEALRLLLNTCGFHVIVAHTSQAGLAAARLHQPHIVLCDITLPDADGYTTASMLRQSSYTVASRLIAVTGHGEPLDRQRALAAGFDQHLVKPVDPRELLRELEVTV